MKGRREGEAEEGEGEEGGEEDGQRKRKGWRRGNASPHLMSRWVLSPPAG